MYVEHDTSKTQQSTLGIHTQLQQPSLKVDTEVHEDKISFLCRLPLSSITTNPASAISVGLQIPMSRALRLT